MKEADVKMIGIGLPIVDRIGSALSIPISRSKADLLRSSMNLQSDFGGVVPNVLSSYVALSNQLNNVRIFASIGNDDDGYSFQRRLDDRLGPLQTVDSQETATLFDLRYIGNVNIWELFLGAASHLTITDEHRREMETSGQFYCFTDINTLRVPELKDAIEEVFNSVREQNGYLFLNLAGIQSLSDVRIGELAGLIQIPAIVVVGNEEEFAALERTNIQTITQPQTLKIVTLAENGSVVSYEGREIFIPPNTVPQNQFVNDVGCGDSYMGAFFSVLLTEKPEYWDEKLLNVAGRFAALIASQTAKTQKHSLTAEDLKILKTMYGSKH